jgi:hypothetical protein
VRLRPSLIFGHPAASDRKRILGPPAPPRRPRHHDLFADVAGPFTAADPPIDGSVLAELLRSPPVALPGRWCGRRRRLGWQLRLVPVEPGLLDLVVGLPLLDAHTERRRTYVR